MQDSFNQLMDYFNVPVWAMPATVALIIWSAVWKALGLYHAGKLRQPVWFVVLFMVNTLGILEIAYIFVFSKLVKPKEITINKTSD